jgi:tetratricopeptide (TPR) repeat protein
LGFCLPSRAAAPADLAEADRLYFHRDQGSNLDESQARLEALLAKEPREPELLWRQARGLVRLGERQKSKAAMIEKFERAEAISRQAVEKAPGNAPAHYWLGIAMGRRGEARGVLNSLFLIGPIRNEMKTVIKLDPNHAGAHHVLGEMLMQLPGFAGGSKKDAVKEFEQAVALAPRHSLYYVALAKGYAAVGDKARAAETLQKLLAMKDSDDPSEFAGDQQDGRELLKKLRP